MDNNKKFENYEIAIDCTNSNIDFDNSPFYVCKATKDWINMNGPLRAGVSDFVLGGAKAHVVLEESSEIKNNNNLNDRSWHIMTFSARSKKALADLILKHRNYLKQIGDQIRISDISYTLNTGRRHFENRFAIPVQSPIDAQQKLTEYFDFLVSAPFYRVATLIFL